MIRRAIRSNSGSPISPREVDVLGFLLGPTGSRAQQSAEGLVLDEDPDTIPEPVLYIPTGIP